MRTHEQSSENFGLAVFNPAPCEDIATITVTGLGRSGTTMIARILYEMGIPMGKDLNKSRKMEDVDILAAVKSGDLDRFAAISAAQDAKYEKWAFKCPALRTILPGALARLRAPRVIVPFRDVMAISIRNHIENTTEVETALGLAARGNAKLLVALENISVPLLYLSYEKALQYPVHTVARIAIFCGLELSQKNIERIAVETICNGDKRYFAEHL